MIAMQSNPDDQLYPLTLEQVVDNSLGPIAYTQGRRKGRVPWLNSHYEPLHQLSNATDDDELTSREAR